MTDGPARPVSRSPRRQQLAAVSRHRGEGRLKRQRAQLLRVLENIGEGISVFSRDGRLLVWNSRFAELLELPPDGLGAETTLREIMVRQAARGDFGEVDVEAEVERRLDRFFRDVPIVKERTTITGRILQIRRHAMPDDAVVTLYSDITELKASERQMVEVCRQAELASRAKSEFLANMSHELRTPLTAIIGFSEVISNQIFGAVGCQKYLEYVNDICASALHLLSIINDILDMSKIEAGKLALTKEVLAVPGIIGDAIRMVRSRAQNRNINIVAELSQANAMIWADERAVKQMVLNLLSNAIKFSKEGASVYVRTDVEGEGLIALEIEDFGIGMNPEELERALQPFGQAQTTTTRNHGGTGLGLPITKGLVEAHGGKLTITTCPGNGTKVRVLLPSNASGSDDSSTPFPDLV
jgi:signal transduction histidine kinase